MLYGNRDIIKNLVWQGLRHNLLLLGPKGVGKGTLARKLARDFLQMQCDVHPDLYILDKGNQTIRIEDIRELQTFVSYKPACASKKVFIIDNANNLTIEAQNSLLKVLEDKQQTCIFILVAHDDLLATIHSRVQVIEFLPINEDEMSSYLKEYNESELPLYIGICNGSIGNYIRYSTNPELINCLQAVRSYFNSNIEKKELFNVLGLVKEKDSNNFYEKFADDYDALLSLLESIFIGVWLTHLRIQSDECDNLVDFRRLANCMDITSVSLALSIVASHKKSCKHRGYSKQDFFTLVMNIVEI